MAASKSVSKPLSGKASAQGASGHKIGVRARFSAWLAHHQLTAVETLVKLLANPASALLTWLVVAIALTLPGALWMTLDNMEQLSGRFQASGRITVYLEPQTSITQGQQLSQQIAALPQVDSTSFIDSDSALDDFRANSGLQRALEFLPENPLPAVILVEPPLGLQASEINQLADRLSAYPIVDSVQLDMAWVERLLAMLALGERLILVLGVLLALAILLVVGNTIRLAIAARVDEIRVTKLVGGTNAYVRRPFLYTGLWYGFVGGLLAWVLLASCWFMLSGPVEELARLYGSGFELKPLSAGAAMALLLSAMLLGWLGAWWSVARHLDQIEP
ncbi:permease-like cell division protein FtsX [Bacterioplanoides sp.]|uniref:permease-like cell division protein FtsX n=1 Tax=Bacterioplanoides sp. TaxID=2066072 RepID=UPI003B00D305